MPFWNSSGPTFLDRNATIEAYRALAVAALGADSRIDRVVMFGSVAAGRATSRSDVDLLIVLRQHPLRSMDRIPEYLGHFVAGPMPLDVLPLTHAEIERRVAGGDRFLAQALAEGVVLAARST